MTKSEREKAIVQLHTIWDGRNVPHIPDTDLQRLGDADIAFLVRFWSYKSRWWDTNNAPPFTEEPPMGYTKMFANTVLMPARRRAGGETTSKNFGRTFKGPNGGHLTQRQQEKSQKTTAAG